MNSKRDTLADHLEPTSLKGPSSSDSSYPELEKDLQLWASMEQHQVSPPPTDPSMLKSLVTQASQTLDLRQGINQQTRPKSNWIIGFGGAFAGACLFALGIFLGPFLWPQGRDIRPEDLAKGHATNPLAFDQVAFDPAENQVALRYRTSNDAVDGFFLEALDLEQKATRRLQALKVLGQMPSQLLAGKPQLLEKLQQIVEDEPNSGIRLQAMMSLGQFPGSSLKTSILENAIQSDPNSAIRQQAVKHLLADKPNAESLQQLLTQLRPKSYEVYLIQTYLFSLSATKEI